MIDDKRYYQRITGLARAACLSGKFFSSLFAQSASLINGSVPFILLVYVSIFGKCLIKIYVVNNFETTSIVSIFYQGMLFSAIWAFLMPTVTNSVYFHNQNPEQIDQRTRSAENNIPDNSFTSQERKTHAAIKLENKVI